MADESSMLINVNEILSFFDEKPDWADKHSAAVVAMLFEDLAAATLEHCLKKNGATAVNVRPEPVTTGKKEDRGSIAGSRLTCATGRKQSSRRK